jgi:hypothetical protein
MPSATMICLRNMAPPGAKVAVRSSALHESR